MLCWSGNTEPLRRVTGGFSALLLLALAVGTIGGKASVDSPDANPSMSLAHHNGQPDTAVPAFLSR